MLFFYLLSLTIQMDEQEFVDGFRPTLMEVVAAWYRGSTFVEVLKMTSVFEVRFNLNSILLT